MEPPSCLLRPQEGGQFHLLTFRDAERWAGLLSWFANLVMVGIVAHLFPRVSGTKTTHSRCLVAFQVYLVSRDPDDHCLWVQELSALQDLDLLGSQGGTV